MHVCKRRSGLIAAIDDGINRAVLLNVLHAEGQQHGLHVACLMSDDDALPVHARRVHAHIHVIGSLMVCTSQAFLVGLDIFESSRNPPTLCAKRHAYRLRPGSTADVPAQYTHMGRWSSTGWARDVKACVPLMNGLLGRLNVYVYIGAQEAGRGSSQIITHNDMQLLLSPLAATPCQV